MAAPNNTNRGKKINGSPHLRAVIKVETGIPLPILEGDKAKSLYPFEKLKVGQSFAAPLNRRGSVAGLMSLLHKLHPEIKYTARSLSNEGIIRVWRIK